MAAAIPIIGAIFTSVIVSKIVTVVGEKIGLPENLTAILGTVAGAYAGGAAFNQMSAAQTGATEMATAGSELGSGAGATSGPVAPSAQSVPSNQVVGQGRPPGGNVPRNSGMLSEPSNIAPSMAGSATTPTPPTTPPPPPSTVVPGTIADTAQKSWTERLFSPEKTMDMLMAGMQGMGQAGIRETELEYPEKVATKNASAWAAAYPKPLSLQGYQPPSQQNGGG